MLPTTVAWQTKSIQFWWSNIQFALIGYSLACFELVVALIAHTHIEFKAHNGNVDAIGGAFVANGPAAVAAVMLPNADLPLVHHGTQIPEEWPSTHLAGIRLNPLAHFLSHCVHFPENQHRILASRNQLLRCVGKLQRSHFITRMKTKCTSIEWLNWLQSKCAHTCGLVIRKQFRDDRRHPIQWSSGRKIRWTAAEVQRPSSSTESTRCGPWMLLRTPHHLYPNVTWLFVRLSHR